jgi:uncharacterized membrane protein (DUF2068 family)
MTSPQPVLQSAPARHRGATLLRLIGIFKIAKAVILILIALVLFDLMNKNLGDVLELVAHHLHIAPGSRLLRNAILDSQTITRHKLELGGCVLLLYAAMFATEGIGLVLKKHWAEWMAVITTAGLIPVELYELVEKPGPWKIGALVLNIIIAVYLAIRARAESREMAARAGHA